MEWKPKVGDVVRIRELSRMTPTEGVTVVIIDEGCFGKFAQPDVTSISSEADTGYMVGEVLRLHLKCVTNTAFIPELMRLSKTHHRIVIFIDAMSTFVEDRFIDMADIALVQANTFSCTCVK